MRRLHATSEFTLADPPRLASPAPDPPSPTPAAPPDPAIAPPDAEDELVMFLERDQLVYDTSIPVPRVSMGRRASAALWMLRVFLVVVGAMVVYAFVAQLH